MADRRLQVFHTVARLLSFTKAAEVLKMTQPAVTFQIRQLEEEYNIRLFDRLHNKITLTDAGNLMYSYAEKIFDMYQEMENTVKNNSNSVTGAIKIAATQTIGDYILPDLLIEFRKANPNIKIQLKTADSIGLGHLVENGMVDIVVTDVPSEHKTLCCKEVSYDKMCVVLPNNHELASRSQVSIQDLANHPIVLFEEGSGIRNSIDTYLKAQNMDAKDLNILMELSSPESIKRSVESGVGASILPYSVISKEQQLNSVVILDLTPTLSNSLYFVYRRQKFMTKNIEELVDFSMAYFRNDAAKEQANNSHQHAQPSASSSSHTESFSMQSIKDTENL